MEGKSKFTFLALAKDSTAITATAAIKKAFSIDPGLPIHTTTYDNGQEFSRHEPVAHSLSTPCYFAGSYHSWQRRLSEHTNGLVRQYLPQKTNFLALDQSVGNKIQKKLNSQPRKVLGYKTPLEVLPSKFRPQKIALRA
ncbi:MAG: IS30 family transposase [Candidatus Poribacteria bacterium]|nr:IS30 family transposase [Candidatus Poribacteria bacterium]